MAKTNDDLQKKKDEGKVAQDQPAPGREVPNNGINAGQKPAYDRGDSAQNPAVKGAGASVAEAADYPHKEGGLPKEEAKNYVDDTTPPQSASRIGGGTQDPSKH